MIFFPLKTPSFSIIFSWLYSPTVTFLLSSRILIKIWSNEQEDKKINVYMASWSSNYVLTVFVEHKVYPSHIKFHKFVFQNI